MSDDARDEIAIGWPARSAVVRRAAARFCQQLDWAVLHEMPLPNGRRADLFALRPDGGFCCIEVKSGPRDFLTDQKWPEYWEFCDAFYFAVDADFPLNLLPEGAGLMVVGGLGETDLLRPSPKCPLAPARKRALLHRFAMLAAGRLAAAADPAGAASLRAALRPE